MDQKGTPLVSGAGREILEASQLNFEKNDLKEFTSLLNTMATTLEFSNDDVGSLLCMELSLAARFIRINGVLGETDVFIADLMDGMVI